MKQLFEQDPRNTGGMHTIADQLYNHHLALLDAKPIVNNKPPKSINSAKAKDSINKANIKSNPEDYHNVLKTFQAIVNTHKGQIDTKQPITMNFKKNIANQHSREQKFIEEQHHHNVASSNKKIYKPMSIQERKKNQFDPIAYPVKIFKPASSTKVIDKLLAHLAPRRRRVLSADPKKKKL